MGKRLRHAKDLQQCTDVIAGYTVGLDLSCRDLQVPKANPQLGMDIARGKGQDTLKPVGPWVVPREFVGGLGGKSGGGDGGAAARGDGGREESGIKLTLSVNGEEMVSARTGEMVYSVEEMLMEMSRYTTMEPGDLVFTGAPAGSAKAHGDRWLKVGDVVRAEIEGVGVLEVEVRDDEDEGDWIV